MENSTIQYSTVLVWTDECIHIHYIETPKENSLEYIAEQVAIWYPHLEQNDDSRWQVCPGLLQLVTHNTKIV